MSMYHEISISGIMSQFPTLYRLLLVLCKGDHLGRIRLENLAPFFWSFFGDSENLHLMHFSTEHFEVASFFSTAVEGPRVWGIWRRPYVVLGPPITGEIKNK